VAKAAAGLGRIHVLVNAQGFNVKAPATEFPLTDWTSSSPSTYAASCCAASISRRTCRAGGRQDHQPLLHPRGPAALGATSPTVASKGAVDMMTKQLAVELASKKVLVNAIAPIITITPMTEERVKREADRYEKMLVNVPMGRMGTVADLVGPAVFLASPASTSSPARSCTRRRDHGVRLGRAGPGGRLGRPAAKPAPRSNKKDPGRGASRVFSSPTSASARGGASRYLACPSAVARSELLGAEHVFFELLVLGLVDLADEAREIRRPIHGVEVVVAGENVGVGDPDAVITAAGSSG